MATMLVASPACVLSSLITVADALLAMILIAIELATDNKVGGTSGFFITGYLV
jgi:hypothetical protein